MEIKKNSLKNIYGEFFWKKMKSCNEEIYTMSYRCKSWQKKIWLERINSPIKVHFALGNACHTNIEG
jgi:hypothetical protein